MNYCSIIDRETVLVPAYNAIYNTDADMLEAWKSGKDFKLSSKGPYCSIKDEKYLKQSSSRVLLSKDYFRYVAV